MKPDIDILIPTSKKPERLNNLLCQIHTVLNSGINTRVTLAMDGPYPSLTSQLSHYPLSKVRLVYGAPQGSPAIPAAYCMENLEWGDWMLNVSDDDCVLPWGLRHLWEATKDVSMVIGQTIGVSRTKHLDFSAWKIGIGVIPCHVSTALINMRSLETLPKPWYRDDPLCDYLLIQRMSENFPFKIIPSVVHVQAFAEIENLGPEFGQIFRDVYGDLI